MDNKCTQLLIATTFCALLFGIGDATLRIKVSPDFGCADGRKYGLYHHRDMAACKGTWNGHVKNAHLCSNGWHPCDWNDTSQLSTISFYRASHIHGCFAINAAQNQGNCQECKENTNELAGIGADCPRIDDTAKHSCLRRGRIDATYPSEMANFTACTYRPWLTGVICCKDKRNGAKPIITLSPTSTVRTARGRKVVLKCEASGDPLPQITWYKNGYPATVEGLNAIEITDDNNVLSKIVISHAAPQHDGLYLCKAENSFGFAVSYSSDVTSFDAEPDLHACKNKQTQNLLHGGTVAACPGKWRGSVKKASRQLCGSGWKVCGLKERSTVHSLQWETVTSLPGCYAYDMATSDNFACTKCTHRQKGNRMSGIGSGCGRTANTAASCLRTGRIDVWGDVKATKHHSQKRQSCGYQKGITTGVLCCKNQDEAKPHIRKNVEDCSPPCGPNSHCSRRGVCKCDLNFKAVGEMCLPKHGKCAGITCLNGGHCKRGTCVCQPAYAGRFCEKGSTSPSLFNFLRWFSSD